MFVGGCAKGVIDDGPPLYFATFGDDGVDTEVATGWVEVEEGTMWCGRLPSHPDRPGDPGPVQCDGTGSEDPWVCNGTQSEVNVAGGNPEGCRCASSSIHAYLSSDAIIGDDETPEDEYCELYLFRQEVFGDAAVESCVEASTESFNDCETIMPALDLADTPAMYEDASAGPCAAPVNFGDACEGMKAMPGDNYDDYYSLGTVVSWNQTHSRYDVDSDFFDDLKDNPGWLLNDRARISGSGSAWTVSGIKSGQLADAFGLQDGDAFRKLNGMWINTLPAALEAAEALSSETSFTLEIKRSGNVIEIDYEVR